VIVDAHVHWRGGVYPGDQRAGAEDLFRAMESADVSKAVVVGLDPQDRETIDKVTDTYASRLAAFIDVTPAESSSAPVDEAVRRAAGLGESYIKCGSSELPEDYFRPVLELARSEKLPIMLHTGDFSYTAPAMMAGMIRDFPDVAFILAHMGSLAFVQDAIEVAAAFSNTYLETSGMTSPAMLRRAVSEVGADRILFGSDYPFWHPAVERARIEGAKLDLASTKLIMGENAARLLDL
jgi:predicted TIM-barrel fold metal-dependent hydrolase